MGSWTTTSQQACPTARDPAARVGHSPNAPVDIISMAKYAATTFQDVPQQSGQMADCRIPPRGGVRNP
jgi:hypothetical protein